MNTDISADQHEKMMNEFARLSPQIYKDYVRRDMILEPKRQIDLAKLSDLEFLAYLMHRETSEHLNIYPRYASQVMLTFSEEIFEGLKNLKAVTKQHLPKLRKELGGNAHLIALKEADGLYTQVPRELGDAMMTGKLEYKVEQSEPIVGAHFFTTTTGGYYGILKFYEEEIGKIAPQGSNSYLLGAGWCVTVSDGKAGSPIIAGQYRNVPLEDDIYHVVPIQFFRVHFDSTKKYERENKGNNCDENQE